MMEREKLFNLTGPKRAFLGLQPSFEQASVVVVPVPYDSTASYGVGARFGPNAIIDASTQLELYDIELGMNICDRLPIHTLDELALDKSDPAKMAELVAKAVGSIVKLGKKPVILGGEHSITAGAVAGFSNPKELSVLQIDAHADLRDSYEETKYSHACTMRRVRELTDSAVQVGIRSMCDEEAEYIQKEGIEKSIFYAKDLKDMDGSIDSILSQLKEQVYVTVDADGFDPSLIPGTGTPEPGGLLWDDVLSLMKAVSEKKKVVGFDVVEVLPTPPLRTSEFIAAKLAYRMMGYFWAQH
jgi:agmatinase